MEYSLKDYILVSGTERSDSNHSLGVKIFVKIDREIGDAESFDIRMLMNPIIDVLEKETLRIDPKTTVSAANERAEIEALFDSPIFVEEIPNEYCSQVCCSFKPWFIVTTNIGRIKIGWRKSVIHLEWTDTLVRQTAEGLFSNEEVYPGCAVTRYDKVIHCHGYAKAKYCINVLQSHAIVK